jgi:hypothetical protein
MRTANAIRVPEQLAREFEDDDLDWLIGELDHAIDEAKKRGSLLYKCDPYLARAALDFFRRYHERLELGQSKPDFDSVRMSDEEWNCRFREKIRRNSADPTAKAAVVRRASETTP